MHYGMICPCSTPPNHHPRPRTPYLPRCGAKWGHREENGTMEATFQLTKLACIRDSSVPVGKRAPFHLECPCTQPKTRINLPDYHQRVTCPECGTVYSAQGWVIER